MPATPVPPARSATFFLASVIILKKGEAIKLRAGETLVYKTRPHWIISAWAAWLASIAVWFFFASNRVTSAEDAQMWLGFAWTVSVVTLIAAKVTQFYRWSSRFVFTARRVTLKNGILPQRSTGFPLRNLPMRQCAIVYSLVWLIALLTHAIPACGWGPEGHKVIALIAEQNMSSAALERAKVILSGNSLEGVANWADDIKGERPYTARWHYIDIPLDASTIDLERDCPHGACVLVKTEQFLAALKNPRSNRAAKAEALKFVVHLTGDLHQPLHCENDDDEGGNLLRVIWHGYPDDLHWVWDTGLIQDIDRDPESLAEELERRITREDRLAWDRGSIADWVLQSHRLAQMVAYQDLRRERPPVIGRRYEREADPVVELQLERAGIRLAYLLDQRLH